MATAVMNCLPACVAESFTSWLTFAPIVETCWRIMVSQTIYAHHSKWHAWIFLTEILEQLLATLWAFKQQISVLLFAWRQFVVVCTCCTASSQTWERQMVQSISTLSHRHSRARGQSQDDTDRGIIPFLRLLNGIACWTLTGEGAVLLISVCGGGAWVTHFSHTGCNAYVYYVYWSGSVGVGENRSLPSIKC